MTETPSTGSGAEKINFAYHVIIGVAIGLIALFTVFAWPFAILTGIVIGGADVDRMLGRPRRGSAIRVLAVTGGVLAMLFFGAIIGGLISFLIVALAAFSERVAARTSPIDQGIARILVFIVSFLTWGILFYVLQVKVNLSFGG